MLTLLLALTQAALTQAPAALPDGARLAEGAVCYTLNVNRDGQSRAMGVTWQSLRRAERDGRPVLEVVVHQRMGTFDMRDAFVLDAATLRPLELVNSRNGKTHVTATYGETRITGQRTEADGVHPIDVALTGPVWEGNLYGVTFAALPLAEGAAFTLPYWQYDKGLGQFTVKVTGTETVETQEGPVEAWVLDAGATPEQRLTYLVGKADHRELGYRAGPGSQTLGGDCSALAAQ